MCERTMQTSVSLHTWPPWTKLGRLTRRACGEASRGKPPAHGSCVSAALRPSSHWALPRTRDTTQGRPERWVDRKQAGGVVVILTDPRIGAATASLGSVPDAAGRSSPLRRVGTSPPDWTRDETPGAHRSSEQPPSPVCAGKLTSPGRPLRPASRIRGDPAPAPQASPRPSSSSSPHKPAGARSTHPTWSPWSAPARSSRTASSSNDPTNQEVISKPRDQGGHETGRHVGHRDFRSGSAA